MSQEIRRLHRIKTEFTNFSSSKPPELPHPIKSTEHSIQEDSDDAYCPPLQMAKSHFATHLNDINSIRAEFLEDTYHSKFPESDFADDTHDWGGDSQNLSSDYWHFVGSFE